MFSLKFLPKVYRERDGFWSNLPNSQMAVKLDSGVLVAGAPVKVHTTGF